MTEAAFRPHIPDELNIARYFLDARIEEGRGDRVAIALADREFTYAEVQARANRAANALRAAGIDAEDRVLLLVSDGIEFVDMWFGLLKVGAVFCMSNPRGTEADIDYLLDYTKARAVIADAATAERISDVITRHPRCGARYVVGEDVSGFERWSSALASASTDFDTVRTSKDDIAGWLFTSGTTGKPKGAVHFHHDFVYSTECYAKQVLGLTEDDVFVSVSRLFFGYATGTNLMFPFAVGGTAALFPEKPTPDRLFSAIARHKVTVLTNVPAMIRQMVDSPAAEGADLSSVRMCLSAGEALPPELFERWHARFESAEILDGIGSAEMFHIYITNYPGQAKPGSLGQLVPGFDARIETVDGIPADVGELGRLWVKGDSAALCYWGDHEKSKATFHGDWVKTADLFRQDEDGYFFYAGRGDDILKVRGMFVSPLEIEDCLATHPAVRECAVIGVLDGDGLTIPKAFIALREGEDGDDVMRDALVAHVKGALAAYKFPRELAFVPSLPRNDRGKVMRRALKDR